MPTESWVIDCIKTVFDPEFPLVDIWTMGLIYSITIVHGAPKMESPSEEEAYRDDEGFVSSTIEGQIVIDMTLTTPACPAADYLPATAKESVEIMYPNYQVTLNLVWDPTRTVAMIKDEDLKKMFE